MNETVKKYLPETCHLYYVDYRDDLSGSENAELFQKCISRNSLSPIDERVFEWWDYPEEYELGEIREAMVKDGCEELYEEHLDEIRDWLYEHDKSTPVEDLLRNTGNITFFYSLGLEIDGYHRSFMCNPYRGESVEMGAYRIARKLGIRKGTPDYERIVAMVEESFAGGELRIYFEASIVDLISGAEENCLYWTNADGKTDFKSLYFNGDVKIALYNPEEGSGWETTVTIDKVFPFKRENLFVSEAEHYDIESSFGLCGDWLRGKDVPVMMYKSCRGVINESKNAARIQREAELDRVFREGGCTFGDMNMRRHRDVYYDNNVPCGSHCPHCGTFWID